MYHKSEFTDLSVSVPSAATYWEATACILWGSCKNKEDWISGFELFMRESDTNTNDSKKIGCLNVIAKIKNSAMGPWKKKLILSGQSETMKDQ